MAENPSRNIHNDTWMTDAYQQKGPLGNSPVAISEAKPSRICGSLAFDSAGRIVSVCPSLFAGPQIRIMDPDTLATLGSLDLPDAANPPGTKPYQNFTGGGYFFLDQKDRIWVPTKTDHIQVYSEGADGVTPTLERDYDLTSVLDPVDRADQLGAAGLQRPDLVRLEGERQGRDAEHEDRRPQGEDA